MLLDFPAKVPKRTRVQFSTLKLILCPGLLLSEPCLKVAENSF